MARVLDPDVAPTLADLHWSSHEPYTPFSRLDVDDIDAIRNAGSARLLSDITWAMEQVDPPVCAFCAAVEVARPGEYCSDICRDMDAEQQDATDEHIARPWEFVGWGEEE